MNNYENVKRIRANLARINSCIDGDRLDGVSRHFALDYSEDVSSLLDLLDFLYFGPISFSESEVTIGERTFTLDPNKTGLIAQTGGKSSGYVK